MSKKTEVQRIRDLDDHIKMLRWVLTHRMQLPCNCRADLRAGPLIEWHSELMKASRSFAALTGAVEGEIMRRKKWSSQELDSFVKSQIGSSTGTTGGDTGRCPD